MKEVIKELFLIVGYLTLGYFMVLAVTYIAYRITEEIGIDNINKFLTE